MEHNSSAESEAQQASATEVLQAGLRGSKDEYVHSLETLHTTPCFRQSLLWGIGLGLAIGGHRFKETSKQ